MTTNKRTKFARYATRIALIIDVPSINRIVKQAGYTVSNERIGDINLNLKIFHIETKKNQPETCKYYPKRYRDPNAVRSSAPSVFEIVSKNVCRKFGIASQ